MGPRGYPGGPRGPGVRMPQGMGNEFNGPPGQPLMPNNMDPTRQGQYWQISRIFGKFDITVNILKILKKIVV